MGSNSDNNRDDSNESLSIKGTLRNSRPGIISTKGLGNHEKIALHSHQTKFSNLLMKK